jgi:hypothetical protein
MSEYWIRIEGCAIPALLNSNDSPKPLAIMELHPCRCRAGAWKLEFASH